jgi:multidrug efflux pump subunit AcrA (membrane-fusion protein)
VTVYVTTSVARNALVVPVTALQAQSSGGYAVDVVSGTRHHLVPVTPGLFDSTDGLVQVTGPGLAAGQRVVVPGG